MSSGRSSAQTPWPLQVMGLTRRVSGMSDPVVFGQRHAVGQREEGRSVRRRAVAAGVQGDLRREYRQRAADEPGGAVRVVAGPTAGDQAGPALQVFADLAVVSGPS